MTTGISARAIIAAATAIVGILALAGCSGPASKVGPSEGASASAHASPTPIGSPVTISCSTLVPAAAFAAYGETFALQRNVTPKEGTTAAAVVAQRGKACVWKNSGDGVTITVSVASLPAAALTRLKDTLFEDSHSVPTYTVEGYFTATGGVPRADAFVDPYWVNATSSMFGEPGDAQPIMDAARAAIAEATPAARR